MKFRVIAAAACMGIIAAILGLTPVRDFNKVSSGQASTPPPATTRQPFQAGRASFYDEPQKTASGEAFDPSALTAAHKTLPLGSRATVTNIRTGKSVSVRINDRGPFVEGRIIDLSKKAAEVIGIGEKGVGDVEITLESH